MDKKKRRKKPKHVYPFFKITKYLIDFGQLELTCQIHNPGYETMITLQKTIQNKL